MLDKKRNKGCNNQAKRKINMESVIELVRPINGGVHEKDNLSPVDKALEKFKKENGYDFLDIINHSRIHNKHRLKQFQKKDNDDNDFLKAFQDFQGE